MPLNDDGPADTDRDALLALSADIVVAYLAKNTLPAAELPNLITTIHAALDGLGDAEAPPPPERPKPAVPISRSIQHDYLVCLEDGKQLKMLKRYLRSRYGMSPEDYRRRWNLPPDYPMVAPGYAARRSDFAKQIGLGRGVRSNRK